MIAILRLSTVLLVIFGYSNNIQAKTFPEWFKPIARTLMVYDETNWQEAIQYYTEDIVYQDPIVRIEGKEQVEKHMSNLFRKTSLVLDIVDETYCNNIYMATWQMTLKWDLFGRAKKLYIEGATELRFNSDGRVYYHRDIYSDADIMRALPIFSWPVRLFRSVHRKEMKKSKKKVAQEA